MTKNSDIIEVLRHYRHDWLNVLQLIKGNIALKKIERVEEIIQEVVAQTENESKLSNLKIPSVAFCLLTSNWTNHYYQLEYEIIGEIIDLSSYEHELYSWCKQFFSMLDTCCSSYSENSLLVTFQLLEEGTKITFDYEGEFEQDNKLREWLNNEQQNVGKLLVENKSFINNELVIEISLK